MRITVDLLMLAKKTFTVKIDFFGRVSLKTEAATESVL